MLQIAYQIEIKAISEEEAVKIAKENRPNIRGIRANSDGVSEFDTNSYFEIISITKSLEPGTETCFTCQGAGQIRSNKTVPGGAYQFGKETCHECKGAGVVKTKKRKKKNGTRKK